MNHFLTNLVQPPTPTQAYLFDAVSYLEANGILIDKGSSGNDQKAAKEINEMFTNMINRIISTVARDINNLYLSTGKAKALRVTDKHVLSMLPTQSSVPAATKRRIERIPKQLEIAKLERLQGSNFSSAANRYNIDSYLEAFIEGFSFYDRVLK